MEYFDRENSKIMTALITQKQDKLKQLLCDPQ